MTPNSKGFKKIHRLEGFGIFHDFSWDKGTPDFARFNLIYGWNRSGKTTLSRVFAAFEKGKFDFEKYSEGVKFDIIKDGSKINQSDFQNGKNEVRVFNSDFVKDNVSFSPEETSSSPIVYVGEEDIESKRMLQELQKKTSDLQEKHKSAETHRKAKEKEESGFRIETACSIKYMVSNKAHDKYSNYDKKM